MNPIALYLASGESLYPGALLVLLVMAVSPAVKRRWAIRIRNLAAWVGLGMLVLACPPLGWWVYGGFLSVFVLWFIGWNGYLGKEEGVGRYFMWMRRAATPLLAVMLVVFPAIEMKHRVMPVLIGKRADHLVVTGDSISAGIDPKVPTWPDILRQMTGVSVKNLAQAGAQVDEGQEMAKKVTADDRLVLIEIGGNDLIANVSGEEFGRGLEAILARVATPGRVVVMFELPLLPHKIAYGQIQRRLALKYGVIMIPKRFFIDVISGSDATSDGLHLSPVGTRRMAGIGGRRRWGHWCGEGRRR